MPARRITSFCDVQVCRVCRYALGCWDRDAYVSKYDLPTTDCTDGVPDSTIFYTNSNAIADVSILVFSISCKNYLIFYPL